MKRRVGIACAVILLLVVLAGTWWSNGRLTPSQTPASASSVNSLTIEANGKHSQKQDEGKGYLVVEGRL